MIDVVKSDDDRQSVTDILSAYSMGGIGKAQGELVVYRNEDGDVIGCAALASHWSRNDMWLNCVAVRRDCRRLGIGKKLVRHFIDRMTGLDEIWLETAFWNKRFYESLGFVWIPIKDIDKYYAFDPRARKFTMVMALLPS